MSDARKPLSEWREALFGWYFAVVDGNWLLVSFDRPSSTWAWSLRKDGRVLAEGTAGSPLEAKVAAEEAAREAGIAVKSSTGGEEASGLPNDRLEEALLEASSRFEDAFNRYCVLYTEALARVDANALNLDHMELASPDDLLAAFATP